MPTSNFLIRRLGALVLPQGRACTWSPRAWCLGAALCLIGACQEASDQQTAQSLGVSPLAFDSAREVTVLFGGFDQPGENDTYEWDGSDWTQRATTGPPPLEGAATAFDEARGVLVLFGGFEGASGYSGDTWEWDGQVWTLVDTDDDMTNSPTPRFGAAMVYDPPRNRCLLFGGRERNVAGNSNQLKNDTWAWDGSTWTTVGFTGPPARVRHSMVYDRANDRVVLFGGFGATYLGDTREWNVGTLPTFASWVLRDVEGPSPRALHQMAYDSEREVTVLFGGLNVERNDETWEWDSSAQTWTQRMVEGPSPRAGHGMAYDPTRGVTVLRGGFANGFLRDTWEWDGTLWSAQAATAAHAPPVERIFGLILEDGPPLPGKAGSDTHSAYTEFLLERSPQAMRARWTPLQRD